MEGLQQLSKTWGRALLCCGVLALVGCSATTGIAADKDKVGLSGTAWQLITLQSMTKEQGTITVEQPERYSLHFLADGRVALRLDCNRGSGTWQATPASGDSGQLSFGAIATTRRLCLPPSLESRVSRDLGAVRSYRLRDGHLFLSLQADAGILEWQPAPAEQSSTTDARPQP